MNWLFPDGFAGDDPASWRNIGWTMFVLAIAGGGLFILSLALRG